MNPVTKIITLLTVFITFQSISQFTGPNYITYELNNGKEVISGDIDNDGDTDLISASSGDNKIAWYSNNGLGLFSNQQVIDHNATGAYSIDTADINNDGLLDIVAACQGSNQLLWYRNLGSGNFSNAIIISDTLNSASSVITFDVNNDGYIDVVAGNNQASTNVIWYQNLGNNNFGVGQILCQPCSILNGTHILHEDIDSDGDDDIIFTTYAQLRWLENLGSTFAPEVVIYSGSGLSPANHTIGDLDNDGLLDIVYTSNTSNTVYYLKNLGSGSFSTPNLVSNQSSYSPYSLCTDYDGDGDVDILAAFYGTTSYDYFIMYENLGSLNFASPQIIDSMETPEMFLLADINNNSLYDFVAISSEKINVYESNGSGLNSPVNLTPTFGSGTRIKPFDKDNDGDLDVVIVSTGYNIVSVFENIGNEVYDNEQVILSNGPSTGGPDKIAVGDLDSDGDFDLVISKLNGNEIVWFENIGGQFGAEQLITNLVDQPEDILAIDLDNDLDIDIVSASSQDSKIAWYVNNGAGVFGAQQLISTSTNSVSSIDAADFDNDGDLDIIAVDYLDDTITWYENTGGGSFGSEHPIYVNNGSNEPIDVNCIDIDFDGWIDVFIKFDDRIGWFKNNGGSFAQLDSLVDYYYNMSEIEFGLINNDTLPDLVYRDNSTNTPTIFCLYNQGGGVFSYKSPIVTSINNFYFDLCDIDLDGDSDILSSQLDVFWMENMVVDPFQARGKLFYDQNQNGILDSTEVGISQFEINSIPNPNYAFSYPNGDYFINFNENVFSTYVISPESIPNWGITSDSLSFQITTSSNFTYVDSLNFGLFPTNFIDSIFSDITIAFPRCNDTVIIWLNITNAGTTFPDGVIHLDLDDSLSFISSSISPDSISGQSIYWSYDSLFFNQTISIPIQVQMPDFNSIGYQANSYLNTSVGQFNNASFVTIDTLSQVIQCAYDPNDKKVSPSGFGSEGYIPPSTQTLEYLVRFQNTGNDTANTVIINDVIDTNLIFSSLTLIASSHPVYLDINVDNEVNFIFDNINLPDSATNDLESQGFAKFRVDLKPNLGNYTQIFNQANIFFDLNPAIVTNSTLNTIFECDTSPLNYLVPISACPKDTVLITNPSSDGLFTWSVNSSSGVNDSTIVWVPYTSGLYQMNINYQFLNCSNDTTISIEIYPTPQVDLNLTLPDTICTSSQTIFLSGATPSGGYYSINGNIGSTFDPNTLDSGLHLITYHSTNNHGCSSEDSIYQYIDNCLNLLETENEFLRIFPNPTSSSFKIEFNSKTRKNIEIFNAIGQLIFDESDFEQQSLELDKSQIGIGIFTVRVKEGRRIYITKVVIY